MAYEEGVRQYVAERDAGEIISDPRNTTAQLEYYSLEEPVNRDVLEAKTLPALMVDMVGKFEY